MCLCFTGKSFENAPSACVLQGSPLKIHPLPVFYREVLWKLTMCLCFTGKSFENSPCVCVLQGSPLKINHVSVFYREVLWKFTLCLCFCREVLWKFTLCLCFTGKSFENSPSACVLQGSPLKFHHVSVFYREVLWKFTKAQETWLLWCWAATSECCGEIFALLDGSAFRCVKEQRISGMCKYFQCTFKVRSYTEHQPQIVFGVYLVDFEIFAFLHSLNPYLSGAVLLLLQNDC